MNIEKYFEKNKVIENLAKYEIYYQVSLGKLCSLTQNENIDYNIELQYALGSIYELLKDLSSLENIYEIFEDELKKQAAMDALQKFANDNLADVKTEKIEIEHFVHEINDNKFFNNTMTKICEENKKTQINKWQEIITDDLSKAIIESLNQLENK
ncbi:hypothetical protein ACH5BK_12265 [Arcobacter sp. YIC-80]|uniref:hypothetical protein n=1 Tax=Arcobacter sp. YIC-80 TaxID=3376683 RepID=UPI00384F7075